MFPEKWMSRVIFVLLLALVVVSCASPSPEPAQEEEEQKTVTLGAAISLTGNLAREGSLVKEGYDMWMQEVNEAGGLDIGGEKYLVDIKYYDDESDAQRSTKLVEKLITEDGIKFILGPYGSGITVASSVISEKYGAIMIATQATSDSIYERDFDYLFGTMGYGSWSARPALNLAMQQEPKPESEAIIVADSLFPLTTAEGDEAYAQEIGLDVPYYEKFPMDITDMSPILSQIKAADPDILNVHGYFEHSVLVIKQLKELGWSPKMLIMDVGPTMPDFREALGQDAEYAMSSQYWGVTSFYDDPVFGSTENYLTLFEERYGRPPDYHNVSASVGAMSFGLGMEKAGSLDVDEVRDAIASIDTETIYGPLRFDENGMNVGVPGVVLQVQNDEVVTVYPPEVAGSDVWYPLPAWDER